MTGQNVQQNLKLQIGGIEETVTIDDQEVHGLSARPSSAARGIPRRVSALEAVQQWQYTETLLDCIPVEVAARVTVNFAVARTP